MANPVGHHRHSAEGLGVEADRLDQGRRILDARSGHPGHHLPRHPHRAVAVVDLRPLRPGRRRQAAIAVEGLHDDLAQVPQRRRAHPLPRLIAQGQETRRGNVPAPVLDGGNADPTREALRIEGLDLRDHPGAEAHRVEALRAQETQPADRVPVGEVGPHAFRSDRAGAVLDGVGANGGRRQARSQQPPDAVLGPGFPERLAREPLGRQGAKAKARHRLANARRLAALSLHRPDTVPDRRLADLPRNPGRAQAGRLGQGGHPEARAIYPERRHGADGVADVGRQAGQGVQASGGNGRGLVGRQCVARLPRLPPARHHRPAVALRGGPLRHLQGVEARRRHEAGAVGNPHVTEEPSLQRLGHIEPLRAVAHPRIARLQRIQPGRGHLPMPGANRRHAIDGRIPPARPWSVLGQRITKPRRPDADREQETRADRGLRHLLGRNAGRGYLLRAVRNGEAAEGLGQRAAGLEIPHSATDKRLSGR